MPSFGRRLKVGFGMLGCRCRTFKFETVSRLPSSVPDIGHSCLEAVNVGAIPTMVGLPLVVQLRSIILERPVAVEEAFSLANADAEMTH